MRKPSYAHSPGQLDRRRFVALLLLCFAALSVFLYFDEVPRNPPGFFADESSIAYNAHLIARTGADEHGTRWPLFFRAFGEYKSPVYIYALAALFKLTGPSIFAARMLSAFAGLAAAALLGLLAWRSTGGRLAGIVVGATALLTPWLFEVSRLVFEVSLFPALLALLLLVVHDSASKDEWSWRRALTVGVLAGSLAYTYSAGRLLAPLYAAGFALFLTRRRWRGVVLAWAGFALTLAPLFVFHARHPGALGARFADVAFARPGQTRAEIALIFLKNYAGNFSPVSWLVAGDPEPRHHVPGMGSVLAATFVLALCGLALVALRRVREARWWGFVIYGLLVSAIPSALTVDHFHTLRLIGLPVFALALTAPAVARLARREGPHATARGALLVALLLLTLAQGAAFQWMFRREAPRRWHNFDAFYPEVLDAALARPERPVYVRDAHAAPGYIHAYWYGALRGLDPSNFKRLTRDERAPAGSLVISTELPCEDCEMILHRGPFRAYVAR